MTRGRRKDLTIPPSRALIQQRDYRARKARYVAELEERCQRLEQDNLILREQVDMLQAKLHSAGSSPGHVSSANPEVMAASSDLMHQLAGAAASLARFQQLAFGSGGPSASTAAPPPQMIPHSPITLATPSFTPSPVPFPGLRLPSPRPIARVDLSSIHDLPSIHGLHREPYASTSTTAYPHRALPARVLGSPPSTSGYSESECCGGYVDCGGLVEESGMQSDEEDSSPASGTLSHFAHRTSDVRSTSSDDGGKSHAGRSR